MSGLALDEKAYAEHLAARVIGQKSDQRLAFVRVVDDGPLSPNVLESRLHTQPGDPVDADALAQDAARLHGLKIYEQVDYRLVTHRLGSL